MCVFVRQALQRQATKLQLVIQDMQADAETKSRESTDSLLQLKLEHEQACATIVRQYENAAEETRTDLKQMASHAEDLASKLAKSERIRVQNCDLHHEEMRTVKASLAMEQVLYTLFSIAHRSQTRILLNEAYAFYPPNVAVAGKKTDARSRGQEATKTLCIFRARTLLRGIADERKQGGSHESKMQGLRGADARLS